MKSKANVNVYLVLNDNESLLFSKRCNTGYEDGKWSLVAGHVEEGEGAAQAMMREAKEEIGITIAHDDIQLVHVMHRKTDRENIDLFFKCKKWMGTIINNEPHKCSDLDFFRLDNMPSPVIPYIESALECIKSKKIYSELGF